MGSFRGMRTSLGSSSVLSRCFFSEDCEDSESPPTVKIRGFALNRSAARRKAHRSEGGNVGKRRGANHTDPAQYGRATLNAQKGRYCESFCIFTHKFAMMLIIIDGGKHIYKVVNRAVDSPLPPQQTFPLAARPGGPPGRQPRRTTTKSATATKKGKKPQHSRGLTEPKTRAERRHYHGNANDIREGLHSSWSPIIPAAGAVEGWTRTGPLINQCPEMGHETAGPASYSWPNFRLRWLPGAGSQPSCSLVVGPGLKTFGSNQKHVNIRVVVS
ncbi:hypothetical protein B0H16DRAFT_1854939 [Mycena metata]|uniref:Uncharacterized protein n=1 Tax=Mycena metata TaxID=1033252 RepID=A0AAD7IMA3_9AGAR|nr:hypothetical protein B0H16DRAFT_1854939 [Mycena metata]